MDHSTRLVTVALTLSTAVILGCSSASAPTPTASMTVTITSADGSTPYVVVSGPNSYNKVISTTQKLTGLTAGNYTIVADTVVVADSVVGSFVDSGHVTGSPAAVVVGGDVPVTVVYATKARMGGMWVTNNNYGTLPLLAPSQLRTGGALVAAETLATPMRNPRGLGLDASGNMWESGSGDSLLTYSIDARNGGGGPSPTAVILSHELTAANGIGFDTGAELWVTNCAEGAVGVSALYMFSDGELAVPGFNIFHPAATINVSAYAICPVSIAFDANGNAWVADLGAGHILEYSAAQIFAGGSSSPAPADTLGWASPTGGVRAVAVDPSGNLWAGDSNQVVEFTSAVLTNGGSPAPSVIITLPNNASIRGLAFDNRGSLWVADARNKAMYGLTKAQLVTGTPTPSVSISFQLAGGVSPQQPFFDSFATAIAPSVARLRSHPVAPARAGHR